MVNQGNLNVPYILVVDTNTYTGNFEREMTAYVTGIVGECGKGAAEADAFEDEVFDKHLAFTVAELIMQVPDEHCRERPCSVWPTPNRFNDGRGNYFDACELESVATWQNISWPAYESVAIFLKQRSNAEQTQLFINRIKGFAERYNAIRKPNTLLAIKTIRLIKRDVSITDKEVFSLSL
jgi:hypothetical protein